MKDCPIELALWEVLWEADEPGASNVKGKMGNVYGGRGEGECVGVGVIGVIDDGSLFRIPLPVVLQEKSPECKECKELGSGG